MRHYVFVSSCNRVQKSWRVNPEHNCLPFVKENQRDELFLKIPVLLVILLIPYHKLAVPDNAYKLSKFKRLPFNIKETNPEGKMLSLPLEYAGFVCVFVSTKKVNTNLTLFLSLALCS